MFCRSSEVYPAVWWISVADPSTEPIMTQTRVSVTACCASASTGTLYARLA